MEIFSQKEIVATFVGRGVSSSLKAVVPLTHRLCVTILADRETLESSPGIPTLCTQAHAFDVFPNLVPKQG